MNIEEYNGTFNFEPGEEILLIYSAPWCSKCEILKRVVGQMDYAGPTRVMSIDVDKYDEVCREKNILSLPQISMVRESGETFLSAGKVLNERQIREYLK